MNIQPRYSQAIPQVRQSLLFQPLLTFLIVLVVMILLGVGVELFWETPNYQWHNILCPSVILFGGGWTALHLVWRHRPTLWTPIPWFLLTLSLFYGLGPLYYIFGDTQGLIALDSIWQVDDLDLWRTHLTTMLGTCIIIITFLFVNSFFYVPTQQQPETEKDLYRAKRILFWFLGVGLPIKYFLSIPYAFGMFSFVLPSFVDNLVDLVYIALLLTGYLSARIGGRWWFLFWAFFAVEIIVGLLTLSKTALLYVPLTSFLGIFLAHQRIRSLLLGGLVLILLYIGTKPLVSQSRKILYQRELRRGASLSQRAEIVQNAASDMEGTSLEEYSSDTGWWRRFNYATFHAFAMAQYDLGSPGTSFANIHYTLVPRLLWPDKPIMTNVGLEFTELVFGHQSSSTGVGVFGEAYWNGGYLMLLIICAYIGIVYAILSLLAIRFITQRMWLYLPLIFMGIRFGLNSRGWFVVTFVGALALYFAYLAILYVVRALARKQLLLDTPSHAQPNAPFGVSFK